MIVVPKTFQFSELVEKIADGCIHHLDSDENKLFAIRQHEYNKIVLNYHLRTSELLYLGSLKVAPIRNTYTKDDSFFKHLKKTIKSGISNNEKIIENSDERIVIESSDVVSGIAISKYDVDFVTNVFHWSNNYTCNIKDQTEAAKKIFKFAKLYSDYNDIDYKARSSSNTYFISRSTVWNTRALMAAGYDVELDAWMDLDKIENMLLNGDMIFNIHVANGGDGVSEDSVYTFGGWDGEDIFEHIDGIKLLTSETM